MVRLRASIRFEVFKRDNFTCRYCGRSAPDVVLEVDHIIPRCIGGEDINGLSNLVTVCKECNIGKGGRPLTPNWWDEEEKDANKLQTLFNTVGSHLHIGTLNNHQTLGFRFLLQFSNYERLLYLMKKAIEFEENQRKRYGLPEIGRDKEGRLI